MTANKIGPHFTPPRHPSSNGQVENFNRTLKSRIRARCNYANWDLILQEVLHDINASEHSVTKLCPFTIQSGVQNPHHIYDSNFRNYRIESKIDFQKIKKLMDEEKDQRLSKFANPKFSEYKLNDLVLIKNFDSKKPCFLGPFKIIEKSKAGTWYTVKSDTKTFRRHAEHLKIYNQRENLEISNKISHNNIEIEEPVDKCIATQAPLMFSEISNEWHSVAESNDNLPENDIESQLDEFALKLVDKISENVFFEYFSEVCEASESSGSESEESSVVSIISNGARQEYPIRDSDSVNSNFTGISETDPASDSEYEFETNSRLFEVTIESDIQEPETVLEGNLELNEQIHLTSFDKLDISQNRKREREPSAGSVSREKIPNLETELVGKIESPTRPEPRLELKRTNLLIKFENEHRDFFEKLEEKYGEIEQNMMVEQGYIIKLGELKKESLQFICGKFGIKFEEKTIVSELRIKIREFISKNHPTWRKGTSGEFLFFTILNLESEKTLSDLSKTDLKVLVAQYKLPKTCVTMSKSRLIEFIDEYFANNYPRHPRKFNDLIFGSP